MDAITIWSNIKKHANLEREPLGFPTPIILGNWLPRLHFAPDLSFVLFSLKEPIHPVILLTFLARHSVKYTVNNEHSP